MWSTPLTDQQIREYMFRTLKGNESNLQAYYRFDQYDATGQSTLYDITGNGYNGTLTNMDPTTDWDTSAAFNTWEGSDSIAWTTATNWSRSATPASTDNVGLFAWTGGNDVTASGSPTLNHLGVATGASPTLSSGLTVNGNLIVE